MKSEAVQNGSQNSKGVIFSLMAAFTLFLPALYSRGNMFSTKGWWAIISLVLLLTLAYFFYVGSERKKVKITFGGVGLIALIMYIDMYNDAYSNDIFYAEEKLSTLAVLNESWAYGAYVFLFIVLALFYIAFKMDYKEFKKTDANLTTDV